MCDRTLTFDLSHQGMCWKSAMRLSYKYNIIKTFSSAVHAPTWKTTWLVAEVKKMDRQNDMDFVLPAISGTELPWQVLCFGFPGSDGVGFSSLLGSDQSNQPDKRHPCCGWLEEIMWQTDLKTKKTHRPLRMGEDTVCYSQQQGSLRRQWTRHKTSIWLHKAKMPLPCQTTTHNMPVRYALAATHEWMELCWYLKSTGTRNFLLA